MEITLKSFTLITTVILTGLSAGLFYAWSVSVIPGTQKVVDGTYLETMQSINRAILNPAFFLIFFGSLIFLSLSSIYQYHNGITFWFMLAAAILYALGTFGVTVFGNVPLNDQLDILKLEELNWDKIAEFRQFYESNWNRLHLVRTIFAVIAFMLSVLTLFSYSKAN